VGIEQRQSLGEINAVRPAARGKKMREIQVAPVAFDEQVGERLSERENDLAFPRRSGCPAERYSFADVRRGTRPQTD
jgi:hypothetical protein